MNCTVCLAPVQEWAETDAAAGGHLGRDLAQARQVPVTLDQRSLWFFGKKITGVFLVS